VSAEGQRLVEQARAKYPHVARILIAMRIPNVNQSTGKRNLFSYCYVSYELQNCVAYDGKHA
jgi:hypothetical protein